MVKYKPKSKGPDRGRKFPKRGRGYQGNRQVSPFPGAKSNSRQSAEADPVAKSKPTMWTRPNILSGTLTGRMVDGSRQAGTARYIVTTTYLNSTFFQAGGRFSTKAVGYFNEVAKVHGSDRLDSDSRLKLANMAAIGVQLIHNMRLVTLYEKYMNSITRSDNAGQCPVTSPSYLDLVATVLAACPWLPDICYRMADIWTTPLELGGSNPGTKQLPLFYFPVSYRSLTVTNILALVDTLNTYSDGYFMANEMGISGHKPTADDLMPRKAVPALSNYGLWVMAHAPGMCDNGGVESIVTEEADANSDIYWFEHLGIPEFYDLTPLWCLSDAARTNDDWECLSILSVANDKLGLSYFTEDATSVTAYAETDDIAILFLNTTAACVAATSQTINWWAASFPFMNYYASVCASESAWNAKVDGAMFQMFSGRTYVSWTALGPCGLLPEIRTTEQGRLPSTVNAKEVHTTDYRKADTAARQQAAAARRTDKKQDDQK